jgi:hypothetical protein
MVAPFIEFPPSGGTPLPFFNGMSAYFYFKIFSKAPSMSGTTVSGSDDHINQQLCQKVITSPQ